MLRLVASCSPSREAKSIVALRIWRARPTAELLLGVLQEVVHVAEAVEAEVVLEGHRRAGGEAVVPSTWRSRSRVVLDFNLSGWIRKIRLCRCLIANSPVKRKNGNSTSWPPCLRKSK
jgi:hypothetical protein